MMLADAGAEVLCIDREGMYVYAPDLDPTKEMLRRGRQSIVLDLKDPKGVEAAITLVEGTDVLLEGFRPGVMERLGLGPDACLAANPRLIYGRMTGWGQTGPLALKAGHDINYFGLSGSLALCGRAGEPPSPNLNLVADMGGGGMLLAFGVVSALLHARQSGQGQIVDAAMVEGAALLAASVHGFRAMGLWHERGENLIDGGAPFYDVYETSDAGYMAVGALEKKFFANLLSGLQIDPADIPSQHDRTAWPVLKRRFANRFRSKTRAEWTAIFDELDACVTPVLHPEEAARHPHMIARKSFDERGGMAQPMPAPRFSGAPEATALPTPANDVGGWVMARSWGLSEGLVEELQQK